MRWLVFSIALIAAGLFHRVAHADGDAPVECFSSPEAVVEAHPGSHAAYTTHATWWTESSKCWFAGKPAEKPKTKPRAAAAIVPAQLNATKTDGMAPSQHLTHALPPQPPAPPSPPQPQQEVEGTYEENAAALRALMFGPDETATSFEGRFSGIRNMPTYSTWRRCFATPTWDLCQSST